MDLHVTQSTHNQKKRMETLRNDLKVKNNPQNTFEEKFVENKGFDNKGQRAWTTNESNIANQGIEMETIN